MVDSPTFSQLHKTHYTDVTSEKTLGKNLRHEEGKELYTHKKMSSSTVKRAFGMKVSQERIDSREMKKTAGVAYIKQAINKEYGRGMADRVFQNILQQTGKNMADGITGRDLNTIKHAADAIKNAESQIKRFDQNPTTNGVRMMREIYMNESLPMDVRKAAKDNLTSVIQEFTKQPFREGVEVMNYIKDHGSMSTELRLGAANAVKDLNAVVMEKFTEKPTAEGIRMLSDMIKDETLSMEVRQEAVKTLREGLLNYEGNIKDALSPEGEYTSERRAKTEEDVADILFNGTKPDGNKLFSNKEFAGILKGCFVADLPTEQDTTLFRGNNITSRMLAVAIKHCDGGIGQEFGKRLGQALINTAKEQGIALTKENYTTIQEDHVDVTKNIMDGAMEFLKGETVTGPELKEVFKAFTEAFAEKGQHLETDPQEWLASSLLLRSAMPSCTVEARMNGIESETPGFWAMNQLQALANGRTESTGNPCYNPMLQLFSQSDSPLKQFLGRVGS